MSHPNKEAAEVLLPGFRPASVLWSGDGASYPSEQSAQWALRTMRQELVNAGAIARHRGRLFVHLERMAGVVTACAIAKAQQRARR